MLSAEISKSLVGKTISDIIYSSYLRWPMTIEKIIFTDGAEMTLSGNADFARIDSVSLPNKQEIYPEFEQEDDAGR